MRPHTGAFSRCPLFDKSFLSVFLQAVRAPAVAPFPAGRLRRRTAAAVSRRSAGRFPVRGLRPAACCGTAVAVECRPAAWRPGSCPEAVRQPPRSDRIGLGARVARAGNRMAVGRYSDFFPNFVPVMYPRILHRLLWLVPAIVFCLFRPGECGTPAEGSAARCDGRRGAIVDRPYGRAHGARRICGQTSGRPAGNMRVSACRRGMCRFSLQTFPNGCLRRSGRGLLRLPAAPAHHLAIGFFPGVSVARRSAAAKDGARPRAFPDRETAGRKSNPKCMNGNEQT